MERTPSVHSKVCRSYSPYRLAYGTALGLITTCLTVWKSLPSGCCLPCCLRLLIALISTFHAVRGRGRGRGRAGARVRGRVDQHLPRGEG